MTTYRNSEYLLGGKDNFAADLETADKVLAAPTSRIVYVDNDPAVLSHARALLTSALEGQEGLRRGGPAGPGRDPFRR
jgi:hypothetical protein